jgi:haloalkane dehalogenase
MAVVEAVRTANERFAHLPDYPYEPNYVSLDGLRMHYVDVGPRGAEPVLLLHGQPTWSYLYRHVIPVLSAHGLRVIAPDLIGFGRSDKPVQRGAYTVRAHITWLLGLLDQLDLCAITLVAQDWGGPIGLGAATTRPDRFARVVAANTVLHTADASLAGALEWSCHSTPDGQVVIEPSLLDYQRMTQELVSFQPSLFVQGATVTALPDDVLAAYDAPFPDETHCAGARQLPLLMGLTPASACARQNQRTLAALADSHRPLLTAFSDGDPSTRGWAEVLQRATPGAAGQEHCVIAGAGHFLQEDQGAELGEVIARFIGANPL